MLTILFDGIAYGMLLFVLAVGLAVTLGLMNFINLAHGAFAMVGGYITVLLMQRLGVPFLLVPAARLPRRRRCSARCSSARSTGRMYAKPHLDQVLFSIGLVFMAVAAVDYFVGSTQQNIQLPEWLRAAPRSATARAGMGHYRLFIIVVCAALTRGAAAASCRARASAAGCARRSTTSAWPRAWASTSTVVFLLTFAVGSGLAGLGGALGAEVLGLDPTLPAQVHDLFPDRRARSAAPRRSPARCWPRCCSASPTWPASTTSRRSAPSSSTA